MLRRYQTAFRAFLVGADIAVAVAVLAVISAFVTRSAWTASIGVPPQDAFLALVLYVAAWIAILALHGRYAMQAPWSLRREAYGVLQATILFALVLLGALYLLRLSDVSRVVLLAVFPVQAGATIGSRALLRVGFKVVRLRGRNLQFIVIVGTGASARAFAERLEAHAELGLRIVGLLGPYTDDLPERWTWLGPVSELASVVHRTVVDEVAICLPLDDWHDIEVVTALAEAEGKVLRVPVALAHTRPLSERAEELDGMPVISLVPGPDRALELAIKRIVDIAGSALGLFVLSPLLIATACVITVSEGRPVLFRQPRAGLNGRPFRIVKFRTMTRNADSRRSELRQFNEVEGGASFKMTNDPRVTPVGRWLRRTSVDELPQLWNVLRGDMSLVGPRPHPFDDVAGYDAWHRRRLSMKPGMTGLWQVGGRRDADFDHWVAQDLEYIDRWSLWLDLRLLLSTVPALLRAEGR